MKEKIIKHISTWTNRCYPDGLPDEAPLRLEQLNKVPSYKKVCIAIMKNDNHLETLGYSRPFCDAYSKLKRIELIERGVIKEIQLKLNL